MGDKAADTLKQLDKLRKQVRFADEEEEDSDFESEEEGVNPRLEALRAESAKSIPPPITSLLVSPAEQLNNAKATVLTFLVSVTNHLGLPDKTELINDRLEYVQNAKELQDFRDHTTRVMYLQRVVVDFENATGQKMPNFDKREILTQFEQVDADPNILDATLMNFRTLLQEAAAEEEQNQPPEENVTEAEIRAAAEINGEKLRERVRLEQAKFDEATYRMAKELFGLQQSLGVEHMKSVEDYQAQLKRNRDDVMKEYEAQKRIIQERAAEKQTDIEDLPLSQVATLLKPTATKTPKAPIPPSANQYSEHNKKMAQVQREKRMVDEGKAVVMQPLTLIDQQQKSRAPGAPAAAPPPSTEQQPSQNQAKKAQAIANKWWKEHPRGKSRDMNSTSKKVVTSAKDYVPSKNDFRGLDDGSNPMMVKWRK